MKGRSFRINKKGAFVWAVLIFALLFLIGKFGLSTFARPVSSNDINPPEANNQASEDAQDSESDALGGSVNEENNSGKNEDFSAEKNDSGEGASNITVDNPDDLLVLVNKTYNLPRDYVPEDLVKLSVYAPGKSDDLKYLRKEAAEALYQLLDAAEEEGLDLLPASTYRSYDLQKIIFENNVKQKGSEEKANKTSAKPGQSEHQTGLAIDLSCKEIDYKINNSFTDTKQAAWIADNAHTYGFIVRYPKGKEDITGYSYEPWHIRYVGKEAAEYIYSNKITYEEYYEQFLKAGDSNQ